MESLLRAMAPMAAQTTERSRILGVCLGVSSVSSGWRGAKVLPTKCGILSGSPSDPVVSNPFAALDDQRDGDSGEGSETVQLLLGILIHGYSEGYLGPEHGKPRISERTACGSYTLAPCAHHVGPFVDYLACPSSE